MYEQELIEAKQILDRLRIECQDELLVLRNEVKSGTLSDRGLWYELIDAYYEEEDGDKDEMIYKIQGHLTMDDWPDIEIMYLTFVMEEEHAAEMVKKFC